MVELPIPLLNAAFCLAGWRLVASIIRDKPMLWQCLWCMFHSQIRLFSSKLCLKNRHKSGFHLTRCNCWPFQVGNAVIRQGEQLSWLSSVVISDSRCGWDPQPQKMRTFTTCCLLEMYMVTPYTDLSIGSSDPPARPVESVQTRAIIVFTTVMV